MVGKMLILFAGLAFSGMASAGFFDGIKKNLEIVNETLDDVNQQVDDISQEVNDINQQVDDLDAEFDEIQTQTTSLGKSRGSGEAGRRAG
ncbi:MAG TPA: hypothetical protein ENH21_00340, partial [Chromatiales bacterium]|nr:hypothetical protein [Chromatiales bacterium]HEX21861.1 hypothetical protein [Chromatiales bacterium]